MSLFQSTYHSKVYREFRCIDPQAYRDIVRYYERWEEKIRGLDEEEFFELLTAYVDALFEIGAYQKHLLMVDLVIEKTILENITLYKGRDLFRELLFRKAASFYNLREYKKADHILRELIRIDPYRKDAHSLLRKNLSQQKRQPIKLAQATGVFLFLMAALVISLEVLLVRPFYPMHASLIEGSRNSIFLLGCLALGTGYAWRRWQVERSLQPFLRECMHKK